MQGLKPPMLTPHSAPYNSSPAGGTVLTKSVSLSANSGSHPDALFVERRPGIAFKHTPLDVDEMLPQLLITGLENDERGLNRRSKIAPGNPASLFKTMVSYVESKISESTEPAPGQAIGVDYSDATALSNCSTYSEDHEALPVKGIPSHIVDKDTSDPEPAMSCYDSLTRFSRLQSDEGRDARLELLRIATRNTGGPTDALQQAAAEEIRRICIRIGRTTSDLHDIEFQERMFTEIPSFLVDVKNDDIVRRSLAEALSTIAHRAPTLKKFAALVLCDTLQLQSIKNRSGQHFELRIKELLEAVVAGQKH